MALITHEMAFLKALKWKREYRSDREKFDAPYTYTLDNGRPIVLQQQRFHATGFASTVWDSSIVMSKFLERHGERWIDGCRCLDLSAGCGLVAAVLSHQRPLCVMATDLPENLPLLQRNCQANAGAVEICVAAHVWGNTANAAPPFDLVVACDVMYDNANVTSLVSSLDAFMNDDGIALVCHGRNAHAEDAFLHRCQHHFVVSRLEWDAFDADFRSEEISCLILRRSVGQHTFENERAICLSSPH